MHQNRRTGNKVGMEIRNLKVIDRYRHFQQFMRNFFHHHIRAVQQPQLIPDVYKRQLWIRALRSCPNASYE